MDLTSVERFERRPKHRTKFPPDLQARAEGLVAFCRNSRRRTRDAKRDQD
jgi:hypothetical protein